VDFRPVIPRFGDEMWVMNSDGSTTTERSSDEGTTADHRRRRFLALGASVGATLLAGCSSGSGPGASDGAATASDASSDPNDDGTATAAGSFRLLISDQPVAIDEFDSLDVTLDRARIFRSGGEDDDGTTATPDGNATATPTGNGPATMTATSTPTPDADEDEDEDEDGDEQGYSVVDLDGATVDLTTVVGDRAITVFDGELPAGRYAKIELYAAGVEGVVDGETVDVTIPSGKLQITKPFEVGEGDPVDFVFDINVVRRGQSGGYNLLPVISESGVAGSDVEVTEVGDRTDGDGSAGEPPEDAGGPPENESQDGGGNGGRDAETTPTEADGDS
jgi:hypothetical protein